MSDETAHDWRLGTIGFSYPDWTGPLYPSGVSGADRLSHYARWFDSVEIDATFHALPAPATVRRWAEATPDAFRFCLKTPRGFSHGDDLNSPEARDLWNRFLSVAGELGEKLGVILIQLPAAFEASRCDELARFIGGLPDDTRFAVELRHDSWWTARTAELFREHGVCWVCADEVRKHEAFAPPRDGGYRPRPIVPTADFLYVRWIGWHEQFPDLAQEHLDPIVRLGWWSERLANVLGQRPELQRVYGFFGNGYSGHAPATCRGFMRAAGLPEPEETPPPGSLFA